MEPDEDLVRLAQAGEPEAWGSLLCRHRAAMHAVAVAIVGPGGNAEDVVQDACLVALASLGQLRDPCRARAWLTAICRNLARREVQRSGRRVDLGDDCETPAPGPEEALDTAELHDWVWHALECLPETHRDVVVLRYFTSVVRYDSIAAALDVPIGTVRSRLHDARRMLRTAAPAIEGAPHPDHARLVRERMTRHAAIAEEYNDGRDLALLRAALVADARLTITGLGPVAQGRNKIARSLEDDVEVGVQMELLHLVASPDLTVVEAAFHNPRAHPDHCPPFTAQVFRHQGEHIEAIHLHYASA